MKRNIKNNKSYLIIIFLVISVFFTNSCSAAETANNFSSQTVLVGSTPGDSLIKSLLSIYSDQQIDFIRWELILNQAENDSKTYVLNIAFGESQPNTNGFKDGGEKLSFKGVYTVSKIQQRELYQLKSEKTPNIISLVKLNENLFHLLSPDNKLLVGNGGWSYTLNRKDASANSYAALPWLTVSLPVETAREVIFEGRTPCLDFAEQYNIKVGNDCIKLKWRLTLFRDSETNQPTTYVLKGTINRPIETKGKWTIIKPIENNSEAVIYQLDPDKPAESMYFWVGDENLLFFLDKEKRLFTGNSDFSFTLNRTKMK